MNSVIGDLWYAARARNPVILGSVMAVLSAVAVAACLAPARRAASIDPMDAVRHE
jgi:ABC-type lipoprotein release transport system permease subunit